MLKSNKDKKKKLLHSGLGLINAKCNGNSLQCITCFQSTCNANNV